MRCGLWSKLISKPYSSNGVKSKKNAVSLILPSDGLQNRRTVLKTFIG